MSHTSVEVTSSQRTQALVLATLGFAVNFWAWSLISPLGPVFVDEGLATDSALMVAIPVLVGSLGRVVVGALTDRFGGKLMMPVASLLTIVPVLFVGLVGQYSYIALIIGGLFLGIAGTTFAIGVPYVNSWFPKESRGGAIGIYGMGMGGTAIAAFSTVPLYNIAPVLPFLIAAGVLLIYALIAFRLMHNAPEWTPSKRNLGAQLADTAKIKLTWQACYLYALSFGGYVAFSVFLPTLLINHYGLEAGDASLRMAGFVIAAVIMRPIGGIASDRIGAVTTLIISYVAVTLCAVALIFDPALVPGATAAFLIMAIGLGLGSGAVFALVGQTSDPAKVGSITGFVGAAGGLGGFVPPLLLGQLWQQFGSYQIGIVLLALATVVALLVTLWVRHDANQAAAVSHEATTA